MTAATMGEASASLAVGRDGQSGSDSFRAPNRHRADHAQGVGPEKHACSSKALAGKVVNRKSKTFLAYLAMLSMNWSKLPCHLATVWAGPVSFTNQGPCPVSMTAANMR